MKKEAIASRQGGFIRKVMVFVVMACILFIMAAYLASYLQSGSSILGDGTVSRIPTQTSSASVSSTGNNPLLSFLDGSGSGYGGSYGSSDIPAKYRSPYAGAISLSNGNGGYSAQPFEEYVSLRNNSSRAVNITGWTLTNGKGTRPIQTIQNDYLYPVADSATIGEGTDFLDPSGVFQTGPIVMAPGDTAIVTTGGPFISYPFKISTSFRENMCDGYLKNYPFEPPLSRLCPYPTDDPQIRTVTNECYDYMQTLNRCEDPKRDNKTGFEAQTAQCRSFMEERFSYAACVADHGNDRGFLTNEWRIFLGKKAELWASRNETITLYDAKGLIVDRLSY